MAYLSYGFGTGLAYRHDFKAQDEFMLNMLELGERKKERDAFLKRQEREDQDRASENQKKKAAFLKQYYPNANIDYDQFNTKRLDAEHTEDLRQLGALRNSPDFEINPEKQAEAEAIIGRIENSPVVRDATVAKEMYDKAKKDFVEGTIDKEEWDTVQQQYQDYVTQPYLKGATAKEFNYEPKTVDLDTDMMDYFSHVNPDEGYYGSDTEAKTVTMFYTRDEKTQRKVDRKWDSMDETAKKTFHNDKFEWLRFKAKQFTGVERPKEYEEPPVKTDGDGMTPTQKYNEMMYQNALSMYDSIIGNNDTGSDPNLYHLMPVDDTGMLYGDFMYVDPTDPSGKQLLNFENDGSIEFTTYPFGTKKWTTYRTNDADPGVKLIEATVTFPPPQNKTGSTGILWWKDDVMEDQLTQLKEEGKIQYDEYPDGTRKMKILIPIRPGRQQLTNWYQSQQTQGDMGINPNMVNFAEDDETPQK